MWTKSLSGGRSIQPGPRNSGVVSHPNVMSMPLASWAVLSHRLVGVDELVCTLRRPAPDLAGKYNGSHDLCKLLCLAPAIAINNGERGSERRKTSTTSNRANDHRWQRDRHGQIVGRREVTIYDRLGALANVCHVL